MRFNTFRLRIPREHPQQAYRRIHGSVIAIFALTTWDRMRVHALRETIGTITTTTWLDIPANIAYRAQMLVKAPRIALD